jgi:hypothetical protein
MYDARQHCNMSTETTRTVSMVIHTKKNDKQKFKVWLRQGSKVKTTKHTGVKTPFPNHRTKKTRYIEKQT